MRTRIIVWTAALALALGGCSKSSSSPTAPSSANPTPQPDARAQVSAVRVYAANCLNDCPANTLVQPAADGGYDLTPQGEYTVQYDVLNPGVEGRCVAYAAWPNWLGREKPSLPSCSSETGSFGQYFKSSYGALSAPAANSSTQALFLIWGEERDQAGATIAAFEKQVVLRAK